MLLLVLFFLVGRSQLLTVVHSRISPDDPGSLQSAILAANQQQGIDYIKIPPGIYRIPAVSNQRASLQFTNLRNLRIDADNVTLLMVDNTNAGIYFANCYNVTLRGSVTIRNAIIPFTQGSIESINGNSFVLSVDDGYPTTLDDPLAFRTATTYYVFDRTTRRLKDNTVDYYNTNITRIDVRRFHVLFGGILGKEVAVGDLTSMRSGIGGTAVHSDNCERMQFIDVNVEYAGGFAWFETGGGGNHRYERITARPGPKPIGATEEPLMSANADGFHSAGVRRGPTIINSLFTRMPDDGIAVHGEYQMVRQVNGFSLACMRLWPGAPYVVGDRVAVVAEDGVPRGVAQVRRLRLLPDNFLPSISTPWPHFQNNRYYFELELDTDFNGTILPNDVISNIDYTGSGYSLLNNTILNHRARGMLLKASDGRIESNLIDGSSIAGLVMQPELWWGEGNYAERVVIRHNTLARCGYATTGRWSEQAGVLTVHGTGTSPIAYGHDALTIENNLFLDNDGVHMVLDGLRNTVVGKNWFVNAHNKVNDRGVDHGYDGGALVHINRAYSLRLESNRAWNVGPAHTRNLQITQLATQVVGILDGIITET